MKYLTNEQIVEVFSRFKLQNPKPKTELIAVNPFTLLVSVVLSAQATDKSVNKATEELYKIVKTPRQMLDLGEEKLINYIKSIGLYKNKAKNVIKLSSQLCQKYGETAGSLDFANFSLEKLGNFPSTREEFMELSGVGRKTANVMLNVLYGKKVMPVDTHLLRLAPRMGLSSGTKPEQIENDLLKIIPEEFLEHAHHWLILHGRYVCTAKKPQCQNCLIFDLCPKNGL